MVNRIAIIGIGTTGFRPLSTDVSYREMIFNAATKAYADAGIEHTEIGGFVTASEDFHEGYSIADEYTPDQLGSVQKPMQTIPGDFLHGLATAYMMLAAGIFKIVAVEAHSKASNLKTPHQVASFALDPVFNRPLPYTSHFVAGLEMNAYLHESGNTAAHCAEVVAMSKINALTNPLAAYPARIDAKAVLNSHAVCEPLRHLDISARADGAIVAVLATEDVALANGRRPVWIKGLGWMSDSPDLETREWGKAIYAKLASQHAYKMAGIKDPAREINFAEVDDEYSYKFLQHVEAIHLCESGKAGRLLADGNFAQHGKLPVNSSGGSLGQGHLLDATGGAKIYEAVLQLRGDAGVRQVANAKTAVTQAWRGVPTTSGAVVILGN